MLLGAGCSYYKVTDPTSGKVYYTDGIWQPASQGATFKDGRNGNQVTIQNTEVETISKEEYEMGRHSPPPAPPAPAAAPKAAPAAGQSAPADTSSQTTPSPNVFR